MEKKKREREILGLIYADRQVEDATPSEAPDFLVRITGDREQFGVEIAEFYDSQTNARLDRVPDYVHGLLAGGDCRHKDDREALTFDSIDILRGDEVFEKGVRAIIQEVPHPSALCLRDRPASSLPRARSSGSLRTACAT